MTTNIESSGKSMPDLVIIAGPNGSGKSTAAPVLLQNTVNINNFVNADVIAQGLSAFHPEKVAIQAGRIMLDRIHQLAREGATFAFETTLASRTFSPWITRLKNEGYHLYLVFLWLKNEELAISRVQARVKMGGHSVPEETIRRRYHSGLKNFFQLYRPIADSWRLYDNSDINRLNLIASGEKNIASKIEQADLWQQLLKEYYEQ